MINAGHRLNVVTIKDDFSVLQCGECRKYFIILQNVILDVNETELYDFKKALIDTLANNPDDYLAKFLISVSGFKKMQLYLSYNEITSLIDLIKEASIILETNSILTKLNK